ncbi:MAG: FG-GAP-like repeat-containing protein [bacterium]|nr:FG-GAP-like repeat-containing protein [bacterium]
MKRIYLILFLGFFALELAAQSPFVGSISPNSGKAGDIVTITGRGFNATSSNLQVRFGGAIAEIVSSTETLIEVKVPNNAAFDNIYVTNLVTGLTVSSSDLFLYSFDGETFDVGKLGDQEQFITGQQGVFDLCLCDFNNDNTLDIGVTSVTAQDPFPGVVTIYDNQSSTDNLTLNQIDIELQETRYTVCGDLNGDGLPELVLAELSGLNILILENTSSGSTISFDDDNPTVISLPRQDNNDIRNVYEIRIRDLDNNGKPEILATNSSDNTIHIFENTTTTSLSFESPLELNFPDISASSGIKAEDLNNDGLSDIVITNFQDPNAFILENKSNEGDLAFGDITELTFNSAVNDLAIVDFDGNGFKDVALINRASTLTVFRNETSGTGGDIVFTESGSLTTTNDNAWSLGVGDLNGDGLADIVSSSLSTTTTSLNIFINNSSIGNISFDDVENKTIVRNARQIEIADIDGDSRPDIVFTHNVGAANNGDLSVILNKNCVRPTISPSASQIICSDVNLTLEAPLSDGTTYNWEIDTGSGYSVVQSGTDNTINVQTYLSAGDNADIRVNTVSDGATCDLTSDVVNIIVNADTSTPPTPTSNGPVCVGEQLQLTAGVSGSLIYEWTGPNGFTSNEENPVIDDFQLLNAGRYELIINSGSCRSEAGSVVVEPTAFPFISIDANDQTNFCLGTSKELSVTEFDGYTYRWTRNGSDITGSNSATYTTTEDGTYTAILIDGTGCESESSSISLTTLTPMQADFTFDQLKCVDLPLSVVESTNNANASFSVIHDWDFGDGNTVNAVDSTGNIYTTAGTYTITLTATYEDIPECSDTQQYLVTIRDIPDHAIQSDGTEKCPSDSLRVSLPNNFESYLWNTGSTDSITYAVTEDDFNSVSLSVDWVDDAGCTGTSDLIVSNFANSSLTVTPNSAATPLVNDTVSLAQDEKSIGLTVSGGTDYAWTPVEVIENALSDNVTIFPAQVYTTVTVSGTTAEVCRETETIVVVNDNVVARKTFSPNGDGLGFDCWEILGISGLSCTVYIFDSKGTIIFEESEFSDNCVWDGLANGVQVPDGVYYFAMKCDGTDSQFNRTGSILLAR